MRITNEIVWFGKEKQHDFSLANNCQWPLDTFPNSIYTYPSNSYNLQTLATIVTYHTDTWNEMVLNLALKPFISLMNNFQSITLKVYTWIGQRLIRARIDVKKWWKQCLEIAQKDNEVNASLLTNTNTHTHTRITIDLWRWEEEENLLREIHKMRASLIRTHKQIQSQEHMAFGNEKRKNQTQYSKQNNNKKTNNI